MSVNIQGSFQALIFFNLLERLKMSSFEFRKCKRGVEVKKYENIDSALRRLKRLMENEGILNEMRERECFVKPSMKNKRARASAIKREERRVNESTAKARGVVVPKKDKKEARDREND
jgi:small subunit ribosomal protein S21